MTTSSDNLKRLTSVNLQSMLGIGTGSGTKTSVVFAKGAIKAGVTPAAVLLTAYDIYNDFQNYQGNDRIKAAGIDLGAAISAVGAGFVVTGTAALIGATAPVWVVVGTGVVIGVTATYFANKLKSHL